MHLFHIPQYSIQNRNVHISVLNEALWDMEHVHSRICELGQLNICCWTTNATIAIWHESSVTYSDVFFNTSDAEICRDNYAG